MKIEVLFFAQFRDAFGSGQETVETAPGATVADVAAILGERPEWAAVAAIPLSYAVNEKLVRRDHELHDGDRLALLTPVSGG